MGRGGDDRARGSAVERLRASYAALPPARRSGWPSRPPTCSGLAGRRRSPGLDVSGLTGVIAVDPVARTADVQGMCTYEDLVDATLPHGLIPLVVPQLRTITLGGAVTGLGIESTSFRNGLPHESVLEMDVFTGAGEVVTATPADEHADLFATFPNSYGSLGYATRLRIELEPIRPYVALRHVRFDDAAQLAKTVAEIADARRWDGERVDGLDGVSFAPDELYLTLARWVRSPDEAADTPALPSDYTGQQIFYRSMQERETDLLTIHDYLWRWDTDWFWCSRAFGAQHPVVRRLWPRRLAALRRLPPAGRPRPAGRPDATGSTERAGRPQRERVIQDVEVPVDRLPEFLAWFDAEVGMRPVWLCPLRLREPAGRDGAHTWPSYPLEPGATYVNVGFWGTVHVGPDAPEAPRNRAIEAEVTRLGGHKSLYSEAFYDRETFDRLYDGDNLAAVKEHYDPEDRLTDLFDKAVRRR